MIRAVAGDRILPVATVRTGVEGQGRARRTAAPIGGMSGQGEHESIVDPRQVFLTPTEVMARYRWGRTKGYDAMRRRT
jgi:hypothetical protein